MDSSTLPQSAPGRQPADRGSGQATLLVALVLTVIACQLCISMPTPALPDIADRLGTDAAVIGIAQALFFLFGGLLSIILAAYSDYARTRQLMAVATLVAVAGAVVAAVAPNPAVFILGRTLQSTATAIFPLTLRVMRQTLGPAQFGRAMGIITAANGGIVGLDGLLAGWLTDEYGFRAVFAVMALFGVATTAVLVRWIPDLEPTASGRMDWPGLALLSLSLAFIELGIGAGSSAPLGAVVGMLALGVLAFVAFCAVERRRRHPLVPVDFLRSRAAWPVLLTSALVTAGLLSTINFVVPVFSQSDVGFGMSATMSALAFIVPVCLINVFFAPVVGAYAPRLGWRRVMRFSMAGGVLVLVALALGLETRWLTILLVGGIGFALAGAMTPLNGLSAILASKSNPTVLPGINSAAYGLGSSLGFLLAAQLTAADTVGAYRNGIWFAAAVIALGFLTSLLVGGNNEHQGERI